MAHGLAIQELFHAARTSRGAAVAFFLAAGAAVWAFDGDGAVALFVALTLVGIVFWLRGRPRELALQQEITASLNQWMAKAPGQPGVLTLRGAFRDHFQGIELLDRDDEGQRLLAQAIRGFDAFLIEYDNSSSAGREALAGLAASAALHRARSRHHLIGFLDGEDLKLKERLMILDDLVGFEKEFQSWRILVLPALALRIELRLELGEIEAAEADQELLDVHAEGGARDAGICATRRAIADALWLSSEEQEDDSLASSLQTRAFVHYDAWLSQVGNDDAKARVLVAIRNDQVERSERVISLLSELLDDPSVRNTGSARDLMDANRYLGRAHLRLGNYERALRCFSVLMSVASSSNIYLRDADVLKEIGEAETALANAQL